MFEPKQINELNAPLSREHVRQRSQAGRQLSYIEGWHAIAEANRIFGHSEWDRELTCIKQLGDAREIDGKWRVAYMATVRVRVRAFRAGNVDDAVIRDGTGYGSGIDRDLGSAHESALKEAETDAMKRALMTFGNPFGLALYDKEQREVCDAPKDAKPPKQDNAAPRLSNDKAIDAYKETFKFAVAKCDFESEVRQIWADQAGERAKLGIGKDSRIENELVGYCKDRIEEFSKADQRAETMGAA